MDTKPKKLKFSGISFGGIWGGGTTIFSPHYKLSIFRKKKEWKTEITDRKHFSLILLFLIFSVPLDSFYYILQFHPHVIFNFFNFLSGGFIPSSGVNASDIPAIREQNLLLFILVEILSYIVLFVVLYAIYRLSFKGVKTWHGLEHKLIASGEKNDLENINSYSTINDRCGGCYVFTIYTFMILYWLSSFLLLGILLPVGMLTLSFLLMFLEAKFFHKYNYIGIRCGRLLQKYITTKEPTEFQLSLGVPAMKKLLEKEQKWKDENEQEHI